MTVVAGFGRRTGRLLQSAPQQADRGRLPNSEVVVLDGLKHAIMIEASDRFAAPVRQFLPAGA